MYLKKIPNHQISRADSVLLHTVNTNKFSLIFIEKQINSYSTLNAFHLRLWDRKAKFYEDGHKPKHVQATWTGKCSFCQNPCQWNFFLVKEMHDSILNFASYIAILPAERCLRRTPTTNLRHEIRHVLQHKQKNTKNKTNTGLLQEKPSQPYEKFQHVLTQRKQTQNPTYAVLLKSVSSTIFGIKFANLKCRATHNYVSFCLNHRHIVFITPSGFHEMKPKYMFVWLKRFKISYTCLYLEKH